MVCVAGEIQSGGEEGGVLLALPPPPRDGRDALRQTDVGAPERGDGGEAAAAGRPLHVRSLLFSSLHLHE